MSTAINNGVGKFPVDGNIRECIVCKENQNDLESRVLVVALAVISALTVTALAVEEAAVASLLITVGITIAAAFAVASFIKDAFSSGRGLVQYDRVIEARRNPVYVNGNVVGYYDTPEIILLTRSPDRRMYIIKDQEDTFYRQGKRRCTPPVIGRSTEQPGSMDNERHVIPGSDQGRR